MGGHDVISFIPGPGLAEFKQILVSLLIFYQMGSLRGMSGAGMRSVYIISHRGLAKLEGVGQNMTKENILWDPGITGDTVFLQGS